MKLPRELVCYILKIKSGQAWKERKEFIQSLFCEYYLPLDRWFFEYDQFWKFELITSYVIVKKIHYKYGSTVCWAYYNSARKSLVSSTIY